MWQLITFIKHFIQVGQLKELVNKAHNAELKLFLEVELGPVIASFLFTFCTVHH
jgi:hypothetical protein